MATCSQCTFLDLNKVYESYDKKFWCERHDEWHYANEQECWRFCYAYDRSSSVAESYYRASEESQKSNSGCFITTITCNILGYKDNCDTLTTLRKFRNDFLQKNLQYINILATYDAVGPIIARKLIKEECKSQIALNLYNLGISKVVDALNKNDFKGAIKTYETMTNLLIEGYHIKTPNIDISGVPISQLGHGKQYVKKS